MVENVIKKFRKLCEELGGKLSVERGTEVCYLKDEQSLKEIEKFFATIVLNRINLNKDLVAEYNGKNTSESIILDSFYRNMPILRYAVEKADEPMISLNSLDSIQLSNLNDVTGDVLGCRVDDQVICVEDGDIEAVTPYGREVLEKIVGKNESYLDELKKRLEKSIKIMQKSLKDVRDGNVWRYKDTEYVCGIPFTIHQKDDEELALGFGLGASGGYIFIEKDIPDSLIEVLRDEDIAGEVDLLDDMREYCD